LRTAPPTGKPKGQNLLEKCNSIDKRNLLCRNRLTTKKRFLAVFGGIRSVFGAMPLQFPNPEGIESFSPGLRLAAP
jgi:hypothetical protein